MARSRVARVGRMVLVFAVLLSALLLLLQPINTAVAAPPARTVFVHLFEWKWSDVALECEKFLGPKGFSAVQVSPPNEHIDHRSPNISYPYAWWARYQPVTYDLTSRSGSLNEFKNMVQRCNAVGVDIYVDAVINHMADQTGVGVAGSTFNRASLSYPAFSAQDFHGACVIQDSDYQWSDDSGVRQQRANNIRNCQLGGLPDLNTGKEYVRQTIANYLQGLVDMGVKGFRIDAAKHMHPADIDNILDRVRGNFYVFQEVIDPGYQPVSANEYTYIADVTEFKYSQQIGQTFNTGNLAWLNNFGEAWGFLPGEAAVVFVDNHDNQRGHGMAAEVTHRSGTLYDLTNVYMLAWPYGYPKVMSSYEWGGVDDSRGPPHDGNGNTTRVHNSNGTVNCFGDAWKCEHRWRPITNMVAFRNHAVAAGAYNISNWWDNGNDQIAFTRSGSSGGVGFVVINREGGTINRSFQTGMASGTYCNIIAADFDEATGACSGQTIRVGSGGWATLSVGGMSAVAIHVGAKLGATSSCSTQMYLRGTNNGWGSTNMALANAQSCQWTVSATFGSASNERFKFDTFGDWSVNYGDNNSDGFVEQSGADIAITQGSGSYTITFTESNGAYSVKKN